MNTFLADLKRPEAEHDPMPLLGVDHLEMWVGNAAQAAYFLRTAFGFSEVAYAGLETGSRDRTAHVLEQGRVRIVVAGGLRSDHPIAEHHRRHGDGVKVVALSVPDVDVAYGEATARGAEGVAPPQTLEDDYGEVRIADIATYGETLHRFVDRSGYGGAFMPGYRSVEHIVGDGVFTGIDHVVGNVQLGEMERWVKFYEDVFGMTEMIHFSDEEISTEYSALMSKVVADGKGRIKFPINEPAEGKRKSQIDEYLEFYEGPGVQHIALSTRDIVAAVAELSARGVPFLQDARELLRGRARAHRRDRRVARRPAQARHPRRPRRRGLPAPDIHQADRRSADNVLRDHRAARRPRLRRGQLQGPLRGDRARAGREGEPLMRYVSMGRLPAKRHTQFRENGTLLTEEVMGYEGFSGNESILYHLHSPCRVAEVGDFEPIELDEWVPDAHVHRLTDTVPLEPEGDTVFGRKVLMFNSDVEMGICKPVAEADCFYRNGEGDEVLFIHEGSGELETVFGRLPFRTARLRRHPARNDLPNRPWRRAAHVADLHDAG